MSIRSHFRTRDNAIGHGRTARYAGGPVHARGAGRIARDRRISSHSWPFIPLFLFLTLWVGPAVAAFEIKDSTWEGTSEFLAIARERLGMARVKVVPAIPWDEIQPRDALLALHPQRELDYREVAAFLAAGGRLGLLDDYGSGDALLRRFRIHRVSPPLEPREPLRQNPSLPVAVPPETPDSRPHPIVTGVDRVVTNHPTGLETDSGLKLTTVLELPAISANPTALALIGVIGDTKRCGLVAEGESAERPISGAASAPGRCGRLFAMGDPSALINLMMRYPGNRVFAARLVEYLVGDDSWGTRGGNLYVVVNDFTERGSFGKAGGLSGAIEDRLEALERLIAEMRRDGLPAPLAVLLSALAAAGAALWAVVAATRRYRRPAPRYARGTPLVAQGGLAGRAAVLSAETTHRALAVLELKTALEEAVRQRLDLPATASAKDLLTEIVRQDALSQRSSDDLRALLAEMARAENAVARSERIRVPAATIGRMHDSMVAILAELDSRPGRRP